MRISREEMLMDMAQVVSQRGTCSRLQVGCVISRDGRVIVTGYNGAPAGLPHCDHQEFFIRDIGEIWPEWVHAFFIGANTDPLVGDHLYRNLQSTTLHRGGEGSPGCNHAEHAERNAIAFAARYGLALDGAEMDCTHAPCLNCARAIINAGISRVRFVHAYRKTEGVDTLRSVGIEVLQVAPSEGMMRLW